ncbi:AAA family ATPase [Deinococcus sp. HMF7620]|uniref:AAA family ATPase n=1 Tax=Deinococcus arboris TaxID=2682977 RepID=A0A7C9MST5_9DEIO|nr:ParA family protein [Deinococcus arboris]MVN88344.1 AAA family ATPase [Deinococcus arboris]
MRPVLRIAIANDKGGVGKTTTAVTLAALLAPKGRTLLVDGDEKTASALEWHAAGEGLPCEVVSLETFGAVDLAGVEYLVLDTKAGEDSSELLGLAQTVDLLIVPTKPDALSLRALPRTLAPLIQAGVENFRVLITDVPPAPSTDGHEARAALMEMGVPVFARDIRRASAFNKAALAGVPVRAVRGDQRAKLASMDYELVLREILS